MKTHIGRALDDQLCFTIYSAALAIGRTYKPILDELQITYPQYLVLSSLWERDTVPVGVVADRLALEASTLTPVLKRLEAAGLVRRIRNPRDERQVLVSLTPAGRALEERARCLNEKLIETSAMSEAAIKTLNDNVRELIDALARPDDRTAPLAN